MIVRIREHVSVVVVLASLLLLPAVTRAQTGGGIAGAVKDTSGAVMPGVTVEAASPALIEKVRAVVTDEAGQYKIVDLRPGLYSVTFTLPGFKTIKRDAIALTTGFTATVNADMEVGALEETITVTGASPIVDTQNVRTQSVLSHEYLEMIPTGKSAASYASLILGATVGGGPDVGGARHDAAQTTFAIHGSRGQDYQSMVDGMRYNYMGNTGGGTSRAYFVNQLAAQEIVLETAGMGAETEGGGVTQNMVPKDGGNTFSLSAVVNYTGQDLVANNLTDALRARGLTATSSVKQIYDSGIGLGGPFKKDTLWFYTAHRWWGASEYGIGSYFNKTQNTLFYTPDLSRPGISSTPARDNSLRLTWQATPKHKLTVSGSFQANCMCYTGTSANQAPEASNVRWFKPVSLTQASWTYPATNRILFQAGATYGYNRWGGVFAEGVTADSIAVTELSTGFRYGATAGLIRGNYGWAYTHQMNTRTSASYITGSHAFKAGLFVQTGVPATEFDSSVNQAVSYAFRKPTPDAAPVPVSVTQWASPNHDKISALNLGLYAQDQWTLRRLTLNLGVRFDHVRGWVPAQTRPGGRFVPEFHFAKVDNVPNWKDVAPRLGAAYDLFGTGKTAIKASLGRYVIGEAGSLAALASPGAALVSSATRVWNDANGDYVPQETELGPLSNSAFGTVVQNTHYSDEVLQSWGVRHYNWQGSAVLQQELRPGLGLTVGYFRTAYGNFQVFDNLNVTPADYSPYCVTAPVDARLPGGGNQICGLFDILPTKFGAVNSLAVAASDFGKQTEVFNGVDVSLSARFGRGGLLNGGVATGRPVTNRCFVVDSPQELYLCKVAGPSVSVITGSVGAFGTGPYTEVKFNGAYPLPWDLQMSWTYQNLQGTQILANLVYTNAQIAPSLGRNLGQCGTRPQCNGTATVTLIEPGTEFEGRYNQLDLRLSKTIRLGRARLRGMADAYNVFNGNAITSRNNTYGPTWGRPTSIQLGRMFKFGTQLDW